MSSKLSAEDANIFMAKAFGGRDKHSDVLEMEDGRAVVRMKAGPNDLRPGDYISGPAQMMLADTAAYMAVMTKVGLEPMTLTSNLNINFLRPCIGKAIIGEAKVMKAGHALVVMDVTITAEGAEKPSSHAIVTYALPRKKVDAS